MKDKEFASPQKFQLRRKQFTALDEKQTKFLDYKVPEGTTTFYEKTSKRDKNKDHSSDDDSEDISEEDKFSSNHHHFHNDIFLTQIRSKSQQVNQSISSSATSATSKSVFTKPTGLSLTQGNLASLIRQFAEQKNHKGNIDAVRQTLHNDLQLCHNYELKFRGMSRKNEEKTVLQEKKRILSKSWFLQLLRRIKKYKKR